MVRAGVGTQHDQNRSFAGRGVGEGSSVGDRAK